MANLRRILISYYPRPPIIAYLKDAFARTGVEVHGFNPEVNNLFDRLVIHSVNKTAHNLRIIPKSKMIFKDHPLAHLHYRGRMLLEAVRAVRPDAVLIIRGRKFTEEVYREIRKEAVLMGWWIEGEEGMEERFQEMPLFDRYFAMHSTWVDEGRRRGLPNLSLLQHAVSPKAFHPVECEKRYDWCFVGGWSPGRMSHIERAYRISRNGVVYGPKWLKKNFFNRMLRRIVKGSYIAGEELVRLYNESRVVLNITRWGAESGGQRSGLTMRVLEVPACKALLLTDGSRDLEKVVTPGEHVVAHDGLDDFGRKLEHYIRRGEDRERIAERGYRHIVAHHTYDAMAEKIRAAYYDALASKAVGEASSRS